MGLEWTKTHVTLRDLSLMEIVEVAGTVNMEHGGDIDPACPADQQALNLTQYISPQFAKIDEQTYSRASHGKHGDRELFLWMIWQGRLELGGILPTCAEGLREEGGSENIDNEGMLIWPGPVCNRL